jgi:hypothetical protein
MTRATVPARDALQALETILGYAGGWMPVERRRDRVVKRGWHHAGVPGSPRRFADHVLTQDQRWSAEVAFGLPERVRWNGGASRSTVLWVLVSGSDQVARAAKLRPMPTVAIREGSSSRRWLIWMLERPVFALEAEQRNRRIAYCCGSTQKFGRVDMAQFPCPGTFLREGRTRPLPVTCSRLSTASYEPDEVTGRLKEPPDPAAWKEGR